MVTCPPVNSNCSAAGLHKSEDGCCDICVECIDAYGAVHQVGDNWQKDACTHCNCAGHFLLYFGFIPY